MDDIGMIPESPHRPAVPPLLAIFVAVMAVSTAAIFIRFAQAEAPSLVIAAWRLSIATLALAPFALKRGGPELRRLARRELALALLAGVFLALHFASWISSLEYTTVASSVVLVTTTPLWVALLAPLTVKERISGGVLIGMVLTLIGGVAVGLSDTCAWVEAGLSCPEWGDFVRGRAFLGDLLALVGAIAAAFYLLIGRSLRGKLPLIPYIFVVYGVAAGVLVALMLGGGYAAFGYSPQTYLWFVLLALVPQLIGHSTYNWALRYLSAAYVSITLLGEPIGSALLAYLLLGETPTTFKIFGAILILIGIYAASKSAGSKSGASESAGSEGASVG
jgi:drug/metabolite transporter (DMT)-like permease